MWESRSKSFFTKTMLTDHNAKVPIESPLLKENSGSGLFMVGDGVCQDLDSCYPSQKPDHSGRENRRMSTSALPVW